MKRNILTLLATGILLSMLAACETGEENDQNENTIRMIPVETIKIVPEPFDDFIRVSGIVEALDDATISAESSGRIQSIVERGHFVNSGDLIATMDDRLNRAQYEAAKTSFELAVDTYNRLQPLHADSIISTQDFLSARAQRDQAKAQLDQAEKQLFDSSLEAPFSGRVEERFVNSGELISPGMPVARLVNTEHVRITAGIPERYAGQIVENNPVVVRLRSYDGSTRESTISFVGNVIDSTTRTFPIEIELNNIEGNIKPEMVVDLHVKRKTIDNAIIIPRTAIVRDEQGTNVYVAREDDGEKVAELVPVTTGTALGSVIEIYNGLQKDDEVVISGMSTLTSGDHLNVLGTTDSNEKARDLQRRNRPTVSF